MHPISSLSHLASRRLRAAGLEAVYAEKLSAEHLGCNKFDAIFILNVLDRCKDPFDMLDRVRGLLKDEGWLVVSVVLPATQSDAAAEKGSEQRKWNVRGLTFEACAASLLREVFIPSGFELVRLVRAPYFCAGDSYSPVAALDACVLTFRVAASGQCVPCS